MTWEDWGHLPNVAHSRRDWRRPAAGISLSVLVHGMVLLACVFGWSMLSGGGTSVPAGGGSGCVVMVELAGISLSCSPLGNPNGSDVSANSATALESANVPDSSVKIVDAERKEKSRSSSARKAQLQQAGSNTPKGVPQGREGASGQSDLDSQPRVDSSGEKSSHSSGPMNTTGDGAADGAGGPGAGTGQGEGRQGGSGAGQGSGGSGVLSLGDVDQKPRLVKHVEPEYPEHARKKALSGKVMARFRVDESGIVHDPTVASSSPPGIFDQCVLEAVKRWHFEPARHKGKAVPVLVTVPVRFDISGK